MGKRLSDDDVFGTSSSSGRLSDDEVFGSPAQQPAVREVGFLEAADRKIREGGDSFYKYGGLAVSTPARALDSIAGLFGYKPGLEESVFENVVAPAQRRIDKLQLQPNERYTTVGGNLGAGVGALLDPTMAAVMAGGAATLPVKAGQVAMTAAPTVANAFRAVAPQIAGSAVGATLPALKQGYERSESLMQQGVDPTTANLAGLASQAGLIAGIAAPASAGSALSGLLPRIASRGAQGAAGAVSTGAASRALENIALQDEDPRLQQPAVSAETVIPEALMGLVFGQMGGRNSRVMSPDEIVRSRNTYDGAVAADQAARQQFAADWQRFGPFLEANGITIDDPRAGQALNIMRQAEARKAAAAAENPPVPPSPDEAAIAARQAPPAVIPVDSAGRADAGNLGVKVGMMSAEGEAAKVAKEAGQAFDVAARRQRQADADLANNGELAQDYQGSGAAASGGEFDSGIRRVTLLDGDLPIEVLGNDGKVADIRYQDRNGEWHRMQVEAKRISEHDIPQNQRLAQDFRERAEAPRGLDENGNIVEMPGLGRNTMQDERMPRVSTDRITGDQRSGPTSPVGDPYHVDRGPVEGAVERPGEGGLPPPKDGPRREGRTYDHNPVDFNQPPPTNALPGEGPQPRLSRPASTEATNAPRLEERPRFVGDERGMNDRQNPQAGAVERAGESQPVPRPAAEKVDAPPAADPKPPTVEQPAPARAAAPDADIDPWLTHENKPKQAADSQDILDPAKLGKKKVEIDGKKVVAAERLDELDTRRDALRQLIDCLNR